MPDEIYKNQTNRKQLVSNRAKFGRPLADNRESNEAPIQRNNTGMPNGLKSGIENLSGYSMDDVRVHYNSSRPAELNAHAYAQGTSIHLAPGQEKHLPHEAWHVVQQKQGRVRATKQLKAGGYLNTEVSLEREADVMGAKASALNVDEPLQLKPYTSTAFNFPIIQRLTNINYNAQPFFYGNNQQQVVGHNMRADLDPNDPVRGSAPGNGVQQDLMTGLRNEGYRRMVRGHLLNGQLGGLGIAANLFPITAQANSQHKFQVENYVKEAVSPPNAESVRYTVDVGGNANILNPQADFRCRAEYLGGVNQGQVFVDKTIRSIPQQTPVRNQNVDEGETWLNNNQPPVTAGPIVFATANLGAGWGQQGRGYNAVQHAETIDRTDATFMNGQAVDDQFMIGQNINLARGPADLQAYLLELMQDYIVNNADLNGNIPFEGQLFAEPQFENHIAQEVQNANWARLEALYYLLN